MGIPTRSSAKKLEFALFPIFPTVWTPPQAARQPRRGKNGKSGPEKRHILSHILLFLCTYSRVPVPISAELNKIWPSACPCDTQNAVFYCDKAVLSPARRKLKSGNSYFFVTITILQKNSKVVIFPLCFPGKYHTLLSAFWTALTFDLCLGIMD